MQVRPATGHTALGICLLQIRTWKEGPWGLEPCVGQQHGFSE